MLKKFNELYAKIESNEAILNKMIEGLNKIRRVYLKFKSFEEIVKIEKI